MRGTIQAKQDLERLLGKLIAEYAPQQIILFGSHVYGKPDQHSDAVSDLDGDDIAPSASPRNHSTSSPFTWANQATP